MLISKSNENCFIVTTAHIFLLRCDPVFQSFGKALSNGVYQIIVRPEMTEYETI